VIKSEKAEESDSFSSDLETFTSYGFPNFFILLFFLSSSQSFFQSPVCLQNAH